MYLDNLNSNYPAKLAPYKLISSLALHVLLEDSGESKINEVSSQLPN